MPHIVVYSPHLSREKKVACVAALTEAFCTTTGLAKDHLVIHLEEHSYENIAVAGKLLADTIPEIAVGEKPLQEVNE
ncbi:tautomerase family protein [Pseudovibrio ascidiaceicola]|uniref:tautomerase family protein n=1 Tax=Pseudovibrio TaxID=258255 RepID=UPI0007AE4AB9|nr:tautomerase family protein [Pseudovibrio sp. Ad26]KZL12917.1 4-oxalocrotonate tautomerase [Pseudovibrio sp. Ad26]